MTGPVTPAGSAAPEIAAYGASVSDEMESGISSDALWKILVRHDYYANTTTSRAPFILTFNTFVASAIFINWQTLLSQFGPTRGLTTTAGVLLAIAALASLASIEALLRVVAPPRRSGNPQLKSVVFFEHATDTSLDEFRARLAQSSDSSLRADLTEQTYWVARSAADKFRALRRSMDFIRFGQLPPIAILVIVKLALALGVIG